MSAMDKGSMPKRPHLDLTQEPYRHDADDSQDRRASTLPQ